jgi:hypothetical protein
MPTRRRPERPHRRAGGIAGPGPADRRLQLLGAAAAVLLVLAAIPVLANLSRTAEDDTAAVDAETEADALTETFAGDGADDLATATADAAGPGDEMRQALRGAGGVDRHRPGGPGGARRRPEPGGHGARRGRLDP